MLLRLSRGNGIFLLSSLAIVIVSLPVFAQTALMASATHQKVWTADNEYLAGSLDGATSVNHQLSLVANTTVSQDFSSTAGMDPVTTAKWDTGAHNITIKPTPLDSDINSAVNGLFGGSVDSSAFDSRNNYLYLGGDYGELAAYNLASHVLVDLTSKLTPDFQIRTLLYDPVNDNVYIASGNNYLKVFKGGSDPANGSMVDLTNKFSSGFNASAIGALALDPDTDSLYVGNGYGNVSVLSGIHNPTASTWTDLSSVIPMTQNINSLVYDSAKKALYVVSDDSVQNFGVYVGGAWTELSSKLVSSYFGVMRVWNRAVLDPVNDFVYLSNNTSYFGVYDGRQSPANGTFTDLSTQLVRSAGNNGWFRPMQFDPASQSIVMVNYDWLASYYGGSDPAHGTGNWVNYNRHDPAQPVLDEYEQSLTILGNGEVYVSGSYTSDSTNFVRSYNLLLPAAQTVQSIRLNPAGTTPVIAATLHVTTSVPSHSAVSYSLSNDGGITWVPATPDSAVNFVSLGSDVRWRASLSTTDAGVTPTISQLSIDYTTLAASGSATYQVQTNSSSIWTSLTTTQTTPSNTSIGYQIRSANNQADLASAAWSAVQTVVPVNLQALSVPNGSWLEVKATLASADRSSAPTLTSLTVAYVPTTDVSTQTWSGSSLINGSLSGTAAEGSAIVLATSQTTYNESFATTARQDRTGTADWNQKLEMNPLQPTDSTVAWRATMGETSSIASLAYDSIDHLLFIGGYHGEFGAYNPRTNNVVDLRSKLSSAWSDPSSSINQIVFDNYFGNIFIGGSAGLSVLGGGADPTQSTWRELDINPVTSMILERNYNNHPYIISNGGPSLGIPDKTNRMYGATDLGREYDIKSIADMYMNTMGNNYDHLGPPAALLSLAYDKTHSGYYYTTEAHYFGSNFGAFGTSGVDLSAKIPNSLIAANLTQTAYDTKTNVLYLAGTSSTGTPVFASYALSDPSDPTSGTMLDLTGKLAALPANSFITSLLYDPNRVALFAGIGASDHTQSSTSHLAEFTATSNDPSTGTWADLTQQLSLLSGGNNLTAFSIDPVYHEIYAAGSSGNLYVFHLPDSQTALSNTINSGNQIISQAVLRATNAMPAGTGVAYFLSNNGGTNWQPASLDTAVLFTTAGSDMRWKAILTTNDPAVTPGISTLSVTYTAQTDSSGTGSATYQFHTDAPSTWLTLSDTATVPVGSSRSYQIRTATSQAGLANSTWPVPITVIPANLQKSAVSDSSWIELKVTLTSNDKLSSPSLSSIVLDYIPAPVTPGVIAGTEAKPARLAETGVNLVPYSIFAAICIAIGTIGFRRSSRYQYCLDY